LAAPDNAALCVPDYKPCLRSFFVILSFFRRFVPNKNKKSHFSNWQSLHLSGSGGNFGHLLAGGGLSLAPASLSLPESLLYSVKAGKVSVAWSF
jgi:hypothetical protein